MAMAPLPHALPPEILELIQSGQTKAAATAIIARYNVSGIDAHRAISNVLGGVAADADLSHQPPDEIFAVTRVDTRCDSGVHTYLIEVRCAPAGSRFRDEFKLIDVDPETGKRWNSVHFTWQEATSQAEFQFDIDPGEWTLRPPLDHPE